MAGLSSAKLKRLEQRRKAAKAYRNRPGGKEKAREYAKLYRAANPECKRSNDPEKARAATRRRAMTDVPYVEAKPGHPCDCCGMPILKTPHADHDYATGRFRGWVCPRCNNGLSHYERPGWLGCAEKYLKRGLDGRLIVCQV